MRATILPWAIILTKACIMAKGSIVDSTFPEVFLFLVPNYVYV